MNKLFRLADFNADFDGLYRWYLDHGGETVAENFQNAVVMTLRTLVAQPDLGRARRFRHVALRNLRSFPVRRPYNRMLIFYRSTENGITVWRLMDGSRDLPQRLAEPPN